MKRAASFTSIISRSALGLSRACCSHTRSSVNMQDQPSGGLRRVARDAAHRITALVFAGRQHVPSGRPDRRWPPKAVLNNATGTLTRSHLMFAKKTLSARPGADHCQEASHAEEKDSRNRRHEDFHEIRCQFIEVDLFASRASSCAPRRSDLPLRAAGTAPVHFPSTSVRNASLRSSILPCSRHPAGSEATRSRNSSSFSRRASTQAPSRISR